MSEGTEKGGRGDSMRPTDISTPSYFHKVVDCQWACPAHTPVPHYIRLIAEGRPAEAYMANWEANVFPGILGRVCDRPCEPACRRSRVEREAVAICRLKRVAADTKGDIAEFLQRPASKKNGKRVALVGGGPASLTVARDLAPLGYHCLVFDQNQKPGGMMRTRIPQFRLPETVVDEETQYALGNGTEFCGSRSVESLKDLLAEGWDAIFVGTGAPRGLDLDLPGRNETDDHIHVGVDWLANIRFGHIDRLHGRVVVIGGGNTAMDCGRSARRLGAEAVEVVVREDFADMTAASWEKQALIEDGVVISTNLAPKSFLYEGGHLTGVLFEPVQTVRTDDGWKVTPTSAPLRLVSCDHVVIAIGQEAAFSWIERDLGIEFGENGLPKVNPRTFQSTHPRVFFGGDAAFGPKNIVTAVAHGREAAISIDLFLSGRDVGERPEPLSILTTQHTPAVWRRRPEVSVDVRHIVPLAPRETALANIHVEAELGFDPKQAIAEARRCLECDRQTVFDGMLCVECKSCEDACPTDCITFTPNGDETDLRGRVAALNTDQELYVSDALVSGRVMVKSEDVCIHCGLCAENCPTGAWEMQTFLLRVAHAGNGCEARHATRIPHE